MLSTNGVPVRCFGNYFVDNVAAVITLFKSGLVLLLFFFWTSQDLWTWQDGVDFLGV